MKKFIVLFLFAMILINFNIAVIAQEKVTPTSAVDESEIQDFKEKIASKVAELQKKDQTSVAGYVVKNDKTQINIKSEDGKNYQIKIDDILTKVYKISGATKKEIQVKDLVKDDYLIVTGPISDTSVTANEIYVDEKYLAKVGRVTEVDKTNFNLKIMTPEKEEYSLDIESDTAQSILNIKTLIVEKSGFSKIKEGDMVHFVVTKSQLEQKNNQFSAKKILTIPQEFFIK